MALRYHINEVKNSRTSDGKPAYSVSLITGNNTTLDEIAKTMSLMSSFSPGDVSGLIDNLIIIISRELGMGNTVTLDGLGTFSVSAELKSPVTDPKTIRGNDIRIKRICFKPTRDFKRRVQEKASFLEQEIKFVNKPCKREEK